jgi:hypothetical protein
MNNDRMFDCNIFAVGSGEFDFFMMVEKQQKYFQLLPKVLLSL